MMEEAAELIVECSKARRFGLDSWHPAEPNETNRDRIIREFGDLRDKYDLLIDYTN